MAAVLLPAFVGFAVPGAALACSVCGVGREENRVAFILTTLLMTALPLLAVGGIVVWLRSRARALEAQDASGPVDGALPSDP